MNIPFSHHPAIRLFMLSLMGGTAVLILAVLIFLGIEHFAANKTNGTTNSNLNSNSNTAIGIPGDIDTNTPVVATHSASISGEVQSIDDSTITIRVQGYQTVTDQEILTLSTDNNTEYSVVDTRTPPVPGSGAAVEAHQTTRNVILPGMSIAVTLEDSSLLAQSITIIE